MTTEAPIAAIATDVPSTPADAPAPAPTPEHRQSRSERLARSVAAAVEAATKAAPAAEPAAPAAEPAAAEPTTPAEETPNAKALRQERLRLLKQDRAQRDAHRQHEQRLARAEQLDRVLASKDPDKILEAIGISPREYQERLIVRAMKEGAPVADPTEEKIASEVKPLQEQIAALRGEAQQLAQRQELERHITHDIIPVAADAEKYEALHMFHEGADGKADLRAIGMRIAEARAEHYQIHGEWMPIAEVAARLDRYYDRKLTDGLARLTKANRYKGRFAQSAPVATATKPAPVVAKARPNGAPPQVNGEHRLTRSERLRRAVEAAGGRKS